jgi:ubiquitin carboxyl-terminal hydrolase 5/13
MIADMGFNAAQARKALRETGGNPERAIEWLFNNPDDMGDEPSLSTATSTVPSVSTQTTQGGGVAASLGGNSDLPANYRLKAFISHKGPSVHSGHYVATIRQPQNGLEHEEEDEWVLFNDEKVARAPARGGEEMRSLAYLYVYERV